MTFISSILFKANLKLLLRCKDLESSQALKLRASLKKAACNSMITMLEAIDQADQVHADSLKQICIEIADAGLVDLFMGFIDHESDSIRTHAIDILSQAKTIRPEILFEKLQDQPNSKEVILKLFSINKARLNPAFIVFNALELDKDTAERVLDVVVDKAASINLSIIGDRIKDIESPDFRLMLVKFLGKVNSANSAVQLCRFLGDDFKPVVTQSLKSLSQFQARINVNKMLPFIEDMSEDDSFIALQIINKNMTAKLIPSLADLITGKSDDIREYLIHSLMEYANTENLQILLKYLSMQEWQGRNKAVRCLQSKSTEKIYKIAQDLFNDENKFIKSTARMLIADYKASLKPEGVINLNEISKTALHQSRQVREPAIIILGMTENRKSLTILAKIIELYPDSSVVVLKATEQLTYSKGLEIAFKCLKMGNALFQRQALHTIQTITTEKHAPKVCRTIKKFIPYLKVTVRDAARAVVIEVESRFKPTTLTKKETAVVEYPRSNVQTEETCFSTTFNQENEPADDQSTQELQKGDVWMERYRMVDEIGRGAMGRVMLVVDEMVGEQLVLKFMHDELLSDERAKQRFIRELKYSRKISHPNVIRIYEFLTRDNQSAISMEYFESEGIDEILKSGKRFNVLQVLNIVQQVANGMEAAHQKKVIHRDLKPSNILINEEGLVKVVDFGIASELAGDDSALTQIGVVVGSPAFLAPERTKQIEADSLSDIYSLGINAYIMLTGKLPYQGDSMSILYQHAGGKAKPVNQINQEIPEDVNQLVKKMIAVERPERFQSMQEVSQAIEELK